MQLKPNTLLQGGKYKIIHTLGQGGFGITYEAEQVLLRRRVAVKEFFIKDCCERDDTTSRVTIGTGSQKALVEKFRGKFIREAQMIAGMDHPHIVRVLDVFEENDTAYYVMDYLTGGSLADKVKKDGPLSEEKAETYIRQVAEALAYIHSQNTVHLDVKPSNILLNAKDEAVLVDFGISKHYDDTGEQTSSTPVGISKGYAPLEQGRDGDVSQFGPSTDIYALGATFYYLVTGLIPPEASIVNEDGLKRPGRLSDKIWNVIESAMRPRMKDRPQSIGVFLNLFKGNLNGMGPRIEDDNTVAKISPSGFNNPQSPKNTHKVWTWGLIAGLVVSAIIALSFFFLKHNSKVPFDKALIHIPITSNPATNRTVLYDILSNEYDLGSYDDFVKDTDIESKRKKLYEEIKNDYEVGNTYVDFALTFFNAHEYVDLGLSVRWATCNIGASSPESFGDYFAWGETEPKQEYFAYNYKYYISGDSVDNLVFSKYVSKTTSGVVDNKLRLEAVDDAASVNWGGNWRMPTKAELDELREKCVWSFVMNGSHNGYKVTSRTNGNSIFLPVGGTWRDADLLFAGDSGGYWSSSLDSDRSYYANGIWMLSMNDKALPICDFRFHALSIRPVSD